jgi:hypothetical protein
MKLDSRLRWNDMGGLLLGAVPISRRPACGGFARHVHGPPTADEHGTLRGQRKYVGTASKSGLPKVECQIPPLRSK